MGAVISIVPNSHIINNNFLSIIKIKEEIKDRIIYMEFSKKCEMSKLANIFKEYIINLIKK